ncbi:MAG TPA: ABC transporter substrate-binding protein [Crocinitomix sp.]|nr:ABC transporter substrate-binding protein [Crocinitomix sp.]
MKKNIILILILSLFFTISACNNEENKSDSNQKELSTGLVKAEGGRFYGGILKVNSLDHYSSLFPASIADIYSQHISSQIYEGLLRFNQKTLEVEPGLAETFEVDSQNKMYTFKLRKGIKFHDDECFENGNGREVTAEDFKFVFEFLCSNNEINHAQYLAVDYIKGGREYANGKSESVSGLRVIDKYTFQIELVESFASYTNILALIQTAVFPKEAFDKYGENIANKAIGTGPYILQKNEQNQIVLVKNDNYWRKDEFGNQLPFISKVEISFEKDKTKELEMFNNEELDFVWGVPVKEIPNIMGTLDDALHGKNREFVLQSINSLQTQYYGFLLTDPIFKNKKVRQAISFAINRDTIVNFVLQGEGEPAYNGIIPPMKGYPQQSVKGYDYNPQLAKKLFSEAGYPNGKGFPIIKLAYNKVGDVNELIAKTIQKQLFDVLGIKIEFLELTTPEINEKRENAEINFWRYGWIADFPDPSNFIQQFHSKHIIEGKKSSINHNRYSNAEFDKYIDMAMSESDDKKRMEYYAKAESILIEDAAVIPIYYADEIRLVNPLLKNFPINEIEYRDFSVCYFVKPIEKKKVRVYDNLTEE